MSLFNEIGIQDKLAFYKNADSKIVFDFIRNSIDHHNLDILYLLIKKKRYTVFDLLYFR